jgi:hypothetical protein
MADGDQGQQQQQQGGQQQGGQQQGGQQQQQQQAPWHAAVEPEIRGLWENKGIKFDKPEDVAVKVTQFYRDAEKKLGAPASELIRRPKADAPEADQRAYWTALGVPPEAKEYDFNGVKLAGADLEPAFADTMRGALHAAHVAKDAAPTVVKAVVKYLEDAETSEKAEAEATYKVQKAALMKNWGANADFNLMKAMEGARRIGLKLGPDGELADNAAVGILEKSVGYAKVMEMFRKIGAGTSEDTWKDGETPGGGAMTRDGAIARRAELMADQAWATRYRNGGVAEKREMTNLLMIINGIAA